jgi:FkbM family methyltransferase
VRSTLLRMRKIAFGLQHPAARRALRRGVGASVEHTRALARCNFDCIVDVGANRGQFATFARVYFPDCRIISFEPLEEPAAIFDAVFRSDPKTRLVRTALASVSGPITMHVTQANDASSPLPVGREQHNAFGSRVVETRSVAGATMADLLGRSDLGTRNLLKIDTQGYELEVLKGAASLLQEFAAVYCEISFKELYVGQPLASQVVAYLFECGFSHKGLYNIVAGSDMRPLQADALFIRNSQP